MSGRPECEPLDPPPTRRSAPASPVLASCSPGFANVTPEPPAAAMARSSPPHSPARSVRFSRASGCSDLNPTDRAAAGLHEVHFTLDPLVRDGADDLESGGARIGPVARGAVADASVACGVDAGIGMDSGGDRSPGGSPNGKARARARFRAAVMSVSSMDTYLQARQRRADHWRPLCIRFDSPRYHAVPGAPSPVRQPASALPTSARYARFFPAARAPATSATAALGPDGRPAAEAVGSGSLGTAGRGQSGSFGRWGGASTASGIGAAGSPPRVRIHRSRGLNRADVRLLRSSDANVRIPENIGKWLTQPSNCAPDALNRRRGQRILYTAKISLRFKDHILAQSPCAYALACPFPVMVAQYAYDLWRVYTCAGCPAGVSAWDQPMLWHAKGYDLRAYFHIYNNRIEVNYPTVRCPWGVLGCGSWNADDVRVHYFDRGTFGFRRVPCATQFHCCCAWEPFGEVVGRQRCPCNGPLVDRSGKVRCGQWWCDHWLCTTCCCHYHYPGLVDAEEAATACDVALQAYFDGEELSQEEFDARLDRELARRYRRRRRFGKAGAPIGGRAGADGGGLSGSMAKEYDVDSHAYSRSMTLVAVSIGALTIAIQIFVVIAFAMYVQYRWHRQWYINYAHTLSRPEHYQQIFENATRTIDNLLPGGDD